MHEIGTDTEMFLLEQEVERALRVRDFQCAANTISAIVAFLFENSDYGACKQWLEKELSIREQVQDQRALFNVLHNLGRVHSACGENSQSIGFYRRAVELSGKIQDYRLQAQALNDLGSVLSRMGETSNAIAVYEQAVEICQSNGDLDAQIEALGSLGYLNVITRQSGPAIAYLESALSLQRSAHPGVEKPILLVQLGRAQYDLNRLEEAANLWTAAALAFGRAGDLQKKRKIRKTLDTLRHQVNARFDDL